MSRHGALGSSPRHVCVLRLCLPRYTDTPSRVSLGLFLAMIDSSIVATGLLTIAADLGNFDRINWVALAYILAFVGCSAFFARLPDIIGRRNAFLLAYLLFFAFSIGCGCAQNLSTLVVCRAFQGIGGSGLYVCLVLASGRTLANYRQFLCDDDHTSRGGP